MDGLSKHALDHSFESLTPDIALPDQFGDLWGRANRTNPEPRLAIAVLQLAVVDFCKFGRSLRESEQRVYRKARNWILDSNRDWPYSFANICEVIDVSPENLREALVQGSLDDHNRTLRDVGKLLDIGRG